MELRKSLVTAAILASTLGLTACDGDDGDNGVAGTSQTTIELNVLGTYASGIFDQSAAEIVAHDPANQRLFVINAKDASVDVLDIQDPTQPVKMATIDATKEGATANGVAVYGNLVAVAIEAEVKQDNGKVVFYNTGDLGKVGEVEVGALPDMVTFTRDGRKVLVANEGEPSDDYTVDPEGSVSIIDLSAGVAGATVTTADFRAFNGQEDELRAAGVRIFGPGASAAQDFEPEYIAVSIDNTKAWVALQENNAVAVLDIEAGVIARILPLGFKDHSILGNELDASNRDLNEIDNDGRINIRNWPVKGMYQPDAITSYGFNGKTYYITANEGDARDYGGFSEEFRVKDLKLAPGAFPEGIGNDENLGRLKVTSTLGVSNGCDPSNPATNVEVDCEYSELYSYGARSFSIWSEDGALLFDSGSEFERITARMIPANFNGNNDENSFDNRSDDKGPEPEGVVTGEINGQTFAFIGLERVGGIMVYNVTNPQNAVFVQYLNNRNFSATQDELEAGMAGDLGPEGLAFIAAEDSPNGEPMLAVGNEVSGTTTLYGIDVIELTAN
ncbi:choice-of-anchor I family protein [Marinobacter halophilus]|uniref:Alkaline phosphatase n=1 Tax=Marinobacter halophilus TaxID=1323740 RepID=A0A2T1KF20_9GAMM|nr:choice-of-anchor I family protein [Marinobacter halophilus]PSF08724.1 alkaline phosphatase [Marinobacter halophilus]GGC63249.1 alkaline phosphatase [Marinobacter halophilus]